VAADGGVEAVVPAAEGGFIFSACGGDADGAEARGAVWATAKAASVKKARNRRIRDFIGRSVLID
jgi:hypothetical protein